MHDTQNILILGASSAISRALAFEFAIQYEKASFCLAGRDLDDIEHTAADLQIRFGCNVQSVFFDALDFNSHSKFLDSVIEQLGDLTIVVVAFGTMNDQIEASGSFQVAESMISSNFVGAVSILTHVANYFEKKGRGVVIGISSVAGDRGRQSNYVYGASKGAFSLFLQGLRNRLFHSGVRVITVKPGFVDTAMTYGMKLPPIVASPVKVARDIVKAIGGSSDIVYTPFFWRYIMLIIRLIPEVIFKRLKL